MMNLQPVTRRPQEANKVSALNYIFDLVQLGFYFHQSIVREKWNDRPLFTQPV